MSSEVVDWPQPASSCIFTVVSWLWEPLSLDRIDKTVKGINAGIILNGIGDIK